MDLRHSINSFSCLFSVSDGALLSSATKVPKNAAKNYVFGFPRRDMVVMCSLLRTSRNRYLRTRTLSRIVLLLFPQASRCCLYREAAFLFYRLAARRCRADGTSGRRPLRAVYRARPVGRDPCVPPHDMHVFRRGTRAPPYNRVRRSYRADRVVRPYEGTSRTPSPTAICSSAHTAGSAPPAG